MELKVSHMGLELTYIGLKLTYIGLNLTYMGLKLIIQGVQDQIFQKEFAVPPFECISDPKLVNTK